MFFIPKFPIVQIIGDMYRKVIGIQISNGDGKIFFKDIDNYHSTNSYMDMKDAKNFANAILKEIKKAEKKV